VSGGDAFTSWAAGYGRIRHTPETRKRVQAMLAWLEAEGIQGDGPALDLLHAADRVASAGLWVVVHETYARNVYLDGRRLGAADFKPAPEGHTGGALNMVPAYTGYLLANALTGTTRAWLMGQGHCVAAVDSVNLLVNNMTPAHAARYSVTDEGLTRYVRDFYSYRLTEDGRQDSPLGSHVNAHTAGGLAEGGYLGFVELSWVHMPLPGERLVVFLSDGAFEEQRGSDWAPRWWRAEDSGLVAPIMIANGRRIDQRTTMHQQGGITWFLRHQRLNGYDPFVFDGRDPAAFAWAILEGERRLQTLAAEVRDGLRQYPVPLPYGVAVAPKGAGFHGAGTNLAHNLPLGANPHIDRVAARTFNTAARRLWVPPEDLQRGVATLQQHGRAGRPPERDHPLARRDVRATLPAPESRPVPEDRRDPRQWGGVSPMVAIDRGFLAVVRANPGLRPRVGNPDEMRSNRMIETLEALHFRVTAPEPGIPESIHGAVVTALNEEAVAAAALANQAGVNIVVTYEAFGAKMHGVIRQELIFAEGLAEAGRPPGWLSVPVVLTSHTWENAKNEQSHQDPMLAEALLNEMSHVSRVVFPADFNSAAVVLRGVFATRGQIWALVVPKADRVPNLLRPEEAAALLREGALRLDWASHRPDDAALVLTAVGGYQLAEVLAASARLRARDVPHTVVCMLEPGRFRDPRSPREAAHQAPETTRARLYPGSARARVFLTHTRPEPLLGVLRPLVHGARAAALGFINAGGTLSIDGMLWVNRATWAHVLDAAARLLDLDRARVLEPDELAALDGRRSPMGVVIDRAPEPQMPG
jgi:phosphoketolase